MAKRPMNARIDADVIDQFDAWCARKGSSRTAELDRLMRETVAGPTPTQKPAPAQTIRGAPARPRVQRRDVSPRFKR